MKNRLIELMITLFVPVVASAQVTVFSDNFSSGSTINASEPSAPTPTSTSYEEIASKAWSPNPTLTAGDLKFGIGSTSGGGTEVQALFTTTPVVLQNAGDSIQLAVVFTTTQGILSSASQWGIGLLDAGQVSPWGGGLNGTADNKAGHTDAAIGGAQNWQGYIAQIANGNLNSQFAVRPQQDNGDNRNQVTEVNGSTIYGYQNPTYINKSGDLNVTLTDGNQYAEVLTYTLLDNGSEEMVASLYANNVGGTLLTTMAATNSSPLSLSFDGLSIGFKSTANTSANIVEISSVQVVTTATYSGGGGPTCITESGSPASLNVGQPGGTVTISIPADATASGPVSVDLVSSNPAVAYAADATGGTLTVTFPENSPYTTTNLDVTAVGSGSTVFYLANATTCIADGLSSSPLTVTCDPISLSPSGSMVSLVGQTSQTLAVSIPPYANINGPVTVDLVSLNPSVVTPQGAVGGTLSLTFPAGGTNSLTVALNVLTQGTATLVLTNDAGPVCTQIPANASLVVTVPVTDGISNKTESFDSQSQAMTDGWMDFQDQVNGESYGWSDSANAGGDAGEAGGSFVRYTNRNYYADVTIGPLTLNDSISASGLLFIAPPSVNAAFNLCFFNTNDTAGSHNILGIGLADGSFPSSRISVAAGLTDGTYHEIFGPAQLGAATPITWSFDYDPTAGATGNGRLTINYNVNDTDYSINVDLTAADRAKGGSFNAFGLLVRGVTGLDTTDIMGIYMDNVTYTKGYSLTPSSIPLQVQLVGSSLTFTWSDPSFSLAFSTNIAGPYVKIPEATTGFTTSADQPAGFFRLEWP